MKQEQTRQTELAAKKSEFEAMRSQNETVSLFFIVLGFFFFFKKKTCYFIIHFGFLNVFIILIYFSAEDFISAFRSK